MPCRPTYQVHAAELRDGMGALTRDAVVNETIRVLIADGYPIFRDGLARLLAAGPGTELAGTATTGTEAVEMVRQTQPDVVVIDLHMPELNGIEAIRRIVADSPHVAVVVMTMFADDDSVFAALRAGARGYLLKAASHEQIRQAVCVAAAGEAIICAELAARVPTYFAQAPPGARTLSARERELVALVAQGRTDAQIAAQLDISIRTVRSHLDRIRDKTGCRRRADLTRLALSVGSSTPHITSRG
jgi:DNA-binding NarL/FixJ family response regulator